MEFTKHFYGTREAVAFVDESGDLQLADPGNPLFVLGACMTWGDQLEQTVRAPWLQLRETILGDREKPIHMREIGRRLRPGQIDEFVKFFDGATFKRTSFCVTNQTEFLIDGQIRPPIFELTLEHVLITIAELMGGERPTEAVSIVFEDGPLSRKLEASWAPRRLRRSDGVDVPVSWAIMPRQSGEPALEIADFIAHTAAGYIRDGRNPESKFASRHQSVFPTDRPQLAKGLELNKAELVPNS